jgi:hypothetical protein
MKSQTPKFLNHFKFMIKFFKFFLENSLVIIINKQLNFFKNYLKIVMDQHFNYQIQNFIELEQFN